MARQRNYDPLMDWIDRIIDPDSIFDDIVKGPSQTKLDDFHDEVIIKAERRMILDNVGENRKRGVREAIRQLNSGVGTSDLINHPKAKPWENAREIIDVREELESEWDKMKEGASEFEKEAYYPEEDIADMKKGRAIARIAISRRTTRKRARELYNELYG